MHAKLTKPGMRGFTFIELLTVVTVLAILISIAAPNVGTWIRSTRVRTAASDLYATMILARSEAIKRNANVDILPNASWNAGWRVQAGATVLKQQDGYPGGVNIACDAGGIDCAGTTITYRRDGRINGASSVVFTLNSPADPAVKTRLVNVDLSGRPNVKQ